jgi:hypothetical protein
VPRSYKNEELFERQVNCGERERERIPDELRKGRLLVIVQWGRVGGWCEMEASLGVK